MVALGPNQEGSRSGQTWERTGILIDRFDGAARTWSRTNPDSAGVQPAPGSSPGVAPPRRREFYSPEQLSSDRLALRSIRTRGALELFQTASAGRTGSLRQTIAAEIAVPLTAGSSTPRIAETTNIAVFALRRNSTHEKLTPRRTMSAPAGAAARLRHRSIGDAGWWPRTERVELPRHLRLDPAACRLSVVGDGRPDSATGLRAFRAVIACF